MLDGAANAAEDEHDGLAPSVDGAARRAERAAIPDSASALARRQHRRDRPRARALRRERGVVSGQPDVRDAIASARCARRSRGAADEHVQHLRHRGLCAQRAVAAAQPHGEQPREHARRREQRRRRLSARGRRCFSAASDPFGSVLAGVDVLGVIESTAPADRALRPGQSAGEPGRARVRVERQRDGGDGEHDLRVAFVSEQPRSHQHRQGSAARHACRSVKARSCS